MRVNSNLTWLAPKSTECIDDAAIDRFTDHNDAGSQKEHLHVSPVTKRRKRVQDFRYDQT